MVQVEGESHHVGDGSGEAVVERGGQVHRAGAGEGDVGRCPGIAQVSGRPDDPGHAHVGQGYVRAQHLIVEHWQQLAGPEPPELDHRADVRAQDPCGGLVDHDLIGPGRAGPPAGHDDRPGLGRGVDQGPGRHLAGPPGGRVAGRGRKHQHERAPLAVGDARQPGDPAQGRERDPAHVSIDRAGPGQEPGHGGVGPARARERHQDQGPHQAGDQREDQRAAPVLPQPGANAQPHRPHNAPRPNVHRIPGAIVPQPGARGAVASTRLAGEPALPRQNSAAGTQPGWAAASSSRAMMSFWISLVPSYSRYSRESRYSRSTTVELM